MAGRVLWHRFAEEDLTEAYLRLASDSPAAAERLLDAVETTVEFLRDHPGAGRRREFLSRLAQGIRSWSVKGFESYLVFYRSDGDDLFVVRILHGARDLPPRFEEDFRP